MKRKIVTHKWLLVWALLSVLTLATSAPAFAAALPQEGVGQQATVEDWAARIPLALASLGIAIVVDAIFIVWMLRTRNKNKNYA